MFRNIFRHVPLSLDMSRVLSRHIKISSRHMVHQTLLFAMVLICFQQSFLDMWASSLDMLTLVCRQVWCDLDMYVLIILDMRWKIPVKTKVKPRHMESLNPRTVEPRHVRKDMS